MNNFNVKILQQSEIGSSDSYSASDDGSSLSLQKTIYNNLKSLVKNTNVNYSGDIQGSGYAQFLDDMNTLQKIMYDSSGEEIPDGIQYVNQYLGQLGINESYPIKKDIIHLTKFLNADYEDITPTT